MRVGVLNNLRAGRSRKQVAQVLEVLRSYPDVVHVETESVRALPEALGELTRREVDLLVVNGGDGTDSAQVDAVLDVVSNVEVLLP